MSDAANYLRPEVLRFAMAMERKLRENEHKGGWKHCEPQWLHDRLHEEASELNEAYNDGGVTGDDGYPLSRDNDPNRAIAIRRVLNEAADTANFAMMIADVCGALDSEVVK